MWLGKSAIAAAATTASLLFSAAASARPMSIRGLAAQELHLATIAHRLSAANAAACPAGEIQTGAILHDLTRYERHLRPAVSKAFSMSSGFGVLGIVPGSAAAGAGLKVDDEILAVGSINVEDRAAFHQPRSYDRTQRFHASVRRALAGGEAALLVRRSGRLVQLRLHAQRGCGGTLALMNSSTLNAWADGKHVVVTTGMTSLSKSDDEIAFVIAHEMAHNILRHTHKDARPRGIFGLGGVKRAEVDADSYAVGLMANAGYAPTGAIAFLRNARQRLWWNVSLDHPGFGRRIRTVSDAMRNQQFSQTAGNS